jgi:hypothetical protein
MKKSKKENKPLSSSQTAVIARKTSAKKLLKEISAKVNKFPENDFVNYEHVGIITFLVSELSHISKVLDDVKYK